MFNEDKYRRLVNEFNEKLRTFHGKELDTVVEKNPFTVEIDDEWITARTESSGARQRIRRTNALAALRVLVEKGSLTKKEMEKLHGLSKNKATKLFAIIANANLPGVTVKDDPRTLIYSV